MRSLSGTLLAAQKAASGAPYIRTVVSNAIRGLRHLVFTELYSSGDADTRHGAAAGSTNLHRIRNDSTGATGNAQYQTDATGWVTMSSAADVVHVAIAAIGARVFLFYNRGLGLYWRESTNDGGTFSAEALIGTAVSTLNALAVAYKNAGGDLAIFYVTTATVRRIRRTSGTFGAGAAWTQTANSINGLAACWNGDFLIALTGTETTTLRPTLWSLVLGDGFNYSVDLYTAFFIQAQAETDEPVTFQAPFVAVLEVVRITFVEKFTGSPAYTRTYWTAIALTAAYSPGNWEWLDPVPLNNATAYGYAVAKGGTPEKAIYSRPGQVLTAPTAAVTLDMSADLVEAVIDERDGLTQRAELVFDNSNNQYAGPPAPIALHRTLAIGIGYDALYSSPPAHTITGWQYRRTGGRSQFALQTEGAAYWLALSKTRTSIVETRKMTQIARAAAARAGLDFLLSGASSRATNFNLEWVVNPDQTQLDLLRALAEIMPDIYLISSTGTLTLTEPLAGDSTDYTYGTDHAIYTSRFGTEPTAHVAEVAAAGVLGSAYDYTAMNNDKPIQDRRRSPHETAGSDADANATARLRKSVLARDMGELVTPPNCGLEIADVIAFTDAAVSPSQVKARVTGIKTTMRRTPSSGKATYEQHVKLGGV